MRRAALFAVGILAGLGLALCAVSLVVGLTIVALTITASEALEAG